MTGKRDHQEASRADLEKTTKPAFACVRLRPIFDDSVSLPDSLLYPGCLAAKPGSGTDAR
jgi:hypothetical protein